MASESFVLVINIHQSCCKSFCWGQPRGLLLCILLPPPVSQSLTKSALVLLCRFNPPSTSSIFLPSGFSLSAFISCVAMALLRRASERRRKRDEKSERNNNKKKGVYSTSSQPSVSLWDVRIHLLRYRGGGVRDSCLLTSGRGREGCRRSNVEETMKSRMWRFLHQRVSPWAETSLPERVILLAKWRSGGPAQCRPAALCLVWCEV